jgi:hypothetical protein
MLQSSFYSKNPLFRVDKKNVLYIAYIGKFNNKDTYKYGKSTNVYNREMLSHRKSFTTFEMMNVFQTNFKDQVETQLEQELKIRNIHRELIIKDRKYIELFQPSDEYSLLYIMNLTEELIKYNEFQEKDMMKLEMERLRVEKLRLRVHMKELDLKIKNLSHDNKW